MELLATTCCWRWSIAYVGSGIVIRIGGVLRRRLKHAHPAPTPERQLVRPLYHPRVALIGSESLLGREIRDLAANAEPPLPLRLIAADEEEIRHAHAPRR